MRRLSLLFFLIWSTCLLALPVSAQQATQTPRPTRTATATRTATLTPTPRPCNPAQSTQAAGAQRTFEAAGPMATNKAAAQALNGVPTNTALPPSGSLILPCFTPTPNGTGTSRAQTATQRSDERLATLDSIYATAAQRRDDQLATTTQRAADRLLTLEAYYETATAIGPIYPTRVPRTVAPPQPPPSGGSSGGGGSGGGGGQTSYPCPTARCNDGTNSCSQHRRGTCSRHGGVAAFLQPIPP